MRVSQAIVHSHRDAMTHLGLERFLRLQHVKKLSVVNLQQHTSNLTSQVLVHVSDKREETLSKHLLLLCWWCSSQHSGCQWFLSRHVYCLLSYLL